MLAMHFDSVPMFAGIAVALWIPLSLAWMILVVKILSADEAKLRSFLRPMAAVAILFCIALIIPTDVLSDDAFRYRWDGWVTSHGVNPYVSAPLEHSPDLGSGWQNVSYGHMRTIYPPGAQLTFAGISLVAGQDPLLFKLWWLVILAALYMVLERLLRGNVQRIVLLRAVVLCPVILLNGLMDIHVDSIMALLTVIALVLYEQKHLTMSALILAAAISMKYVPFIALLFLLGQLTWRQRAIYILVVTVALSVLYAPFLGPHMFDSLATFTGKWQTNSALYTLLSSFIDDALIRPILGVAAFLSVCYIWLRHRSSPFFALSASLIALMLCSPVVHPWYLTLPLMLFALCPSRAVIAWGSTMAIYGMGLLLYKGDGVWFDHPIALALEFLPVMVALVTDVRKGPLLFRYEHRPDGIATA